MASDSRRDGARARRALPCFLVAHAHRRVDARTGRRLGRPAWALQARCKRPEGALAATRRGARQALRSWGPRRHPLAHLGRDRDAGRPALARFTLVGRAVLHRVVCGRARAARSRLRSVALRPAVARTGATAQCGGRRAAAGAVADDALRDAPALVVATAIFRRTGRKYGDRSYRYVLADLGHALENLRVTAGALGVSTRFVAAFDESRQRRHWGWTRRRKGCWRWLRWVRRFGSRLSRSHRGRPPGRHRVEGSRWFPPLRAASGAGAWCDGRRARRDLAARGLCAIAGIGGDTGSPPVGAARSTALPFRCAGRAGLVGGDRDAPLGAPLHENVAAARGAGRGAGARECTSRPSVVSCVRVNLVAHEVAGLAPGAYRYEPERHALVPRRVPSACAPPPARAALDQDVIADAAVVFVLSIDRAIFRPIRSGRRAVIGTRFSRRGSSASACTWRPGHAASAPVRWCLLRRRGGGPG